jgi:hypothetical protein
VGGDSAAIRQQFTRVLEYDHAVAQQAPPLLGEACDNFRGFPVDGIGGWTGGRVLTHRMFPRLGGGMVHMTSDARYYDVQRIIEQVSVTPDDNPPFG